MSLFQSEDELNQASVSRDLAASPHRYCLADGRVFEWRERERAVLVGRVVRIPQIFKPSTGMESKPE
jgi:hypothetical protein